MLACLMPTRGFQTAGMHATGLSKPAHVPPLVSRSVGLPLPHNAGARQQHRCCILLQCFSAERTNLREQEVDPAEWGVGAMAASFDEEVPLMAGEGTRRLALLDMDWEHLRAMDILMVLRSFLAEVRALTQR